MDVALEAALPAALPADDAADPAADVADLAAELALERTELAPLLAEDKTDEAPALAVDSIDEAPALAVDSIDEAAAETDVNNVDTAEVNVDPSETMVEIAVETAEEAADTPVGTPAPKIVVLPTVVSMVLEPLTVVETRAEVVIGVATTYHHCQQVSRYQEHWVLTVWEETEPVAVDDAEPDADAEPEADDAANEKLA